MVATMVTLMVAAKAVNLVGQWDSVMEENLAEQTVAVMAVE